MKISMIYKEIDGFKMKLSKQFMQQTDHKQLWLVKKFISELEDYKGVIESAIVKSQEGK